ncbi:MAG: KAP family P-loop NTPase fold protein [Methylobacter sp.]
MQKSRDIEIIENEIFKNDLLDRESEIKNLTPIILNFDDPLVFALDSPWGAGKTTFVRLWQAYLKEEGKQSIYFNAWETDFAEDPLIVLVSELDNWLKATKNESKITKWQRGIKAALPGIAKRSAIAGTKMTTFGALDIQAEYERTAAEFTGNIASDLLENFNKQSKSIQQFKDIITEALNALPSEQKNLVIFIDELDRCRPTYTIELLERIKHLFSIKRLVFILSTNTIQLSHSIRSVYGNDFDARKYLQRFIDLDYALKKPDREKYIDTQFETLDITKKVSENSTDRGKS